MQIQQRWRTFSAGGGGGLGEAITVSSITTATTATYKRERSGEEGTTVLSPFRFGLSKQRRVKEGFSTSFAKPLPASVNRVINERTLASPCRCRFPLFLRTPTQRRWQRRDVVGEFPDEITHLRFHWTLRVGPTISPVKTKVNRTPESRASPFDKMICQLNTRHVAEEDVLSHVSEYHSWR